MNPSRPDEMPQDLGAETALLGCILLDGGDTTARRTIDMCRSAGITPAAFSGSKNRIIYGTIIAMMDNGVPVGGHYSRKN